MKSRRQRGERIGEKFYSLAQSPLLVEQKQPGVIRVAETSFIDEPFPLRAAVVQSRRLKAKRCREFTNQTHILELKRGSAAGREVAPHHAVAVQLQDAAF